MCEPQEYLAARSLERLSHPSRGVTGPLLTRSSPHSHKELCCGLGFFHNTGSVWGMLSLEGGGARQVLGTHRATPLRGGEVHIGDEQHWLRLQVTLGPQERDLIPSEAREQTAFQTYRWRVQFISAPTAHGQGRPFPGLPAETLGTGQENLQGGSREPRTILEGSWGGFIKGFGRLGRSPARA